MDDKVENKRSWFLIVFGAFFALPALFILVKMLGTPLYDASRMQLWESTQGKLISSEVKYFSGETRTYKVVADYTYKVNGRVYEGDRVSVHSGSDNVGRYHQDMARKLRRSDNLVTVYYNPDKPQEAIIDRSLRWKMVGFTSVFVLIFGLVGGGVMYFGWKGNKRIVSPETSEKPWLSNPKWVDNKIESNAKIEMYGMIAFSLIWNLLTWPVLIFQGQKIYEEAEPWVLIFGLFPFIGLYLIYLTMKSVSQSKVFGETPLTLTPFPGSIGGQVGGKIALPRNTSFLATYTVKVACFKKSYTTSGSKRSLRTHLEWEGNTFAKHYSEAGSEGLKFCLDVPDGLPETELDNNESWYEWRVEVASPDIKLKRMFTIPVYQTNEQSTVNYTVPQQLIEQKLEEDLSSALPIQVTDKEVRIHYPMFYKPVTKIVVIVAGIFILGLINQLADEMPSFLFWVFGIIGSLMVFFSVKSLLSTLTVVVKDRTLNVSKGLLGVFNNNQQVSFTDIEGLEKKEVMRSQSGSDHTVHYSVSALLRSGKKLNLTKYIEGDCAANAAESYFREKLGLPI